MNNISAHFTLVFRYIIGDTSMFCFELSHRFIQSMHPFICLSATLNASRSHRVYCCLHQHGWTFVISHRSGRHSIFDECVRSRRLHRFTNAEDEHVLHIVLLDVEDMSRTCSRCWLSLATNHEHTVYVSLVHNHRSLRSNYTICLCSFV